MFQRTRKLAVIAAAALAVAQAGTCWAQAQTSAAPANNGAAQDVPAEIQALRARLDQLEAQQTEAKRVQEQKETSDQVATDADRHSSLMVDTSGFTGGFEENRFVIRSADGNFSFRPWMHLQFRSVTLDRQDFKNGNADSIDNGFELRRMRFGFDGNLFSPDFTYFFNWATVRASGTANVTDASGAKIGTVSNNLGGAPLLEEAWFKYHLPGTDFSIKGGQIKDPLLHDQIVSSRYQQSAERSLTANVFANGDAFTKGVTFIYDPKSWVRTEAGVTDGLRSANTNFLDFPHTNAYDFGVAGRAEFKVMGRWQDYSQVGAVGTTEPLLVFGVGADYSERGHANQTVGVADVMYADPSGLNLYAAAVDRYTNHNFGFASQSAAGASIAAPAANVLDTATNEYSFLVQAGYLIDKKWEPFGRWEYIHVAGTAAGSRNYFNDVTVGVNYYFVGHRAKLTAEVQYLPNGLPFDDTGNDVVTSSNGKGEFSGVVQFQLLL
jgi:hypothetical protein